MTGFFLKIVFYLIAITLFVSSLGGANAQMTEKTVNLPKTIGVWTRSDLTRFIDSNNIFEYMNGAGELYLAYGFDHIEVYEYTADPEGSILVEVYVMTTSNDAFGLLSLDWGGEPVRVYSGLASSSHPSVSPSARALYGGGLLRIWADTLYARVMAYRETPASKQAVLSLGQTIAENRKMPAEPDLLKILPKAVGSVWTLKKDRIAYFRSHLVLNSLYYLSHQNILDLDHSTEAVIAPYEDLSNAGTPKRVQVLFVKYPSPARARKALETFHNAYLHEYQKQIDPGINHESINAFKIEDGWLGYALDGPFLTVVFECPNRESAKMIIKQISLNTPKKERDHEK
jgi:hypothetical protein